MDTAIPRKHNVFFWVVLTTKEIVSCVMTDNFNVNDRIKELCEKYGFSYYELAKRSGIPYSTLNTMLLKGNQPSLSTLRKLCSGFGITFLQFFNTDDIPVALSEQEKKCLILFDALTTEEQALALAYMQGLSHKL